MHRAETPTSGGQSTLFLYLYALAISGGSIAYIPFLTILLPLQASAFAGTNALNLLAHVAFAGAIAASLANIGFGWASDISGTRRPWIAAGLVLSSALLLAMPLATTASMLIAMIVGWQFCLNMMLAPLAAWAGDTVPDSQKGMLGGLQALAPALGALSGMLVTLHGFAGSGERLFWIVGLVAILVAPLLLFGRPIPMPQLIHIDIHPKPRVSRTGLTDIAVTHMWLARLLVQIAEASLFAFLLLWFRSVEPGFGENRAAAIFTFVLGAAVLFALNIGRWSDRTDRPILPLVLCSAIAAVGLLLMSVASDLVLAISGYVVFGLASSIFLALHSSQTLRVLPAPKTRGRDLGLFNLTNTVPSLIMPWLTLALVPLYGFDALFLLLAGLAALACLLLLRIPR
ncbi:MFS transporter [Sphingorhabdus pulchriflava]|uniref:MFS transporter n=1 Tax=Sphingorhabdus pulchriflava TaxID=2292257 RepID=A0A371B1M7_9SPHN|nr:MFS transporter [Sphingorhabdus pulchriflava]RDV01458.1 MFS transporter [Sphingorhabdus pulchriflava]